MKATLLITCSLLYLLFITASVFAQGDEQKKPAENFRVYDSSGKVVTLADVINAMGKAEVVFIGESHNDAVAHQLELQLLQGTFLHYNAGDSAVSPRDIVLSMEMFERDVQTTLDEYMGGLILEKQLLSDARPWNNYQTDYRPLVEFARANNLPVIAANVPTRYANRVSRMGRGSLTALSQAAKMWMAPLPYGEASAAYAAKFRSAMSGMGGGHAGDAVQNFLDAQVLRDATMAYSISQVLTSRQKPLVLHVTGIFHVEGRMGTFEQLEKYRPRTRAIVIALIPATEAPSLDAESLRKSGDFVFVTGTAQP
jgi:uncharacterized iron-regulated protein